MRLGIRIHIELTKPTLTPPQLRPEQAPPLMPPLVLQASKARRPLMRQVESTAEADLVHGLERGDDDHIERDAEKQRRQAQKSEDRDPRRPVGKARVAGARSPRRDRQAVERCARRTHAAVLPRTAANSASGKNRATVMSSMIVAPAAA